MIEFGVWLAHARRRAIVRLMDGSEATLMAVKKGPRSCKIQVGSRHYNCWIDDIALVLSPEGRWLYLDAWKPVDLDKRPGTSVTSLASARASKNWLAVVPNRQALHPSFHSAPQLPPMPVAPIE